MTNCLIFGTGRSGTTALAGSLAKSGIYVGDQLLPPTSTMPYGYFEDVRVNQWNNQILSQVCDYAGVFRAPVPLCLDFSRVSPPDLAGMAELFTHGVYALKDPRFSFTLPVWKPLLKEPTVCLVLFRDPCGFAESAVRLKADWEVITDRTQLLFQEWANTYAHILAHEEPGFHYVRYADVLNGSVFPFLEDLLGYPIDRSFIRPELGHSDQAECPGPLLDIYDALLERMVRPEGISPTTSGSEDRRSNN